MRNARLTALLAIAVTCSGCSRERKPAPDSKPAATPLVATALVYVSDEAGGNVAVVDPAKGEVVASIVVGKRPRGIALSRDRKQLYVAVSGSPSAGPGVDESKLPPPDRSADGVAVVDLATRQVARVSASGPDPQAFGLAPDGATLYVSNEETAELTALALASGASRGKASVGKEPGGVAVRPDGKVVYVACKQDNEVTAVDTTTLAVLGQMPTGKGPRSIVFATDGVTAFVTNELGRTVSVLDTMAQKSSTEIAIHEDSPMPSGV